MNNHKSTTGSPNAENPYNTTLFVAFKVIELLKAASKKDKNLIQFLPSDPDEKLGLTTDNIMECLKRRNFEIPDSEVNLILETGHSAGWFGKSIKYTDNERKQIKSLRYWLLEIIW